jgi:hypothetical protein
MGYSLTVHETQTIQELLEVVAGGSFAQAATERDEVEEFTPTDKLEADELHILSSLLRIRLLAFANFDEAHDIVVLELGESRDFGLDKLIEISVIVENLDGEASASLILGELDLAGDATAEGTSKNVVV